MLSDNLLAPLASMLFLLNINSDINYYFFNILFILNFQN